jgi:tetratricopeptide (TPR) repeat protein
VEELLRPHSVRQRLGTAIPLAAEVCAPVGDSERAAELLLVVTTCIACHGAIARYLGLLARTMGRLDDALQHFQAALAANQRIGAAAISARTATDYAATLLRWNAVDDRKLARSVIAGARTGPSRTYPVRPQRDQQYPLRKAGEDRSDRQWLS